ncbi:prepilin peptidase [Abyssicoccus albus]|uniref:prepilin peptidase n=1 Tax=Abyssicoccus albus TaxID=1817405 RepID=UPI00097E34F3|nr:A24 family peptidase [Abyssicoccus albus]AQL55984.1 hypothetical protein BVH56_03125 [Abyssicoccus albus]
MIIFLFVLGTLYGSFMYAQLKSENVMPILFKRSKCDSCKSCIRWYDLIPIYSYINLQGKCRDCNNQIPIDIFIVELMMGILFTLPEFFVFSPTYIPLYYLIIVVLLPVALIDALTLTIPLKSLIVLTILSLFVIEITSAKLTFFICSAFLLHLFYVLFKEAIGYGDIILFSLLSYIFPNHLFIFILLFTFIIAGFYVVFICFKQDNSLLKIPLVPFILNASILSIILNRDINTIIYGGI